MSTLQSPWGVATGAITGHLIATTIAILGGAFLANYISEKLVWAWTSLSYNALFALWIIDATTNSTFNQVGYLGGALFLIFAVATFFGVFWHCSSDRTTSTSSMPHCQASRCRPSKPMPFGNLTLVATESKGRKWLNFPSETYHIFIIIHRLQNSDFVCLSWTIFPKRYVVQFRFLPIKYIHCCISNGKCALSFSSCYLFAFSLLSLNRVFHSKKIEWCPSGKPMTCQLHV